MKDIDATISTAHLAAEETENQARAIEARIAKIPGAARCLPTRRYGNAINAGDIASNLTLSALIARHDHQLASYLGCASGDHRRREEEAAARKLQAESLRLKTEETRARNQAAAEARYRQQLSPLPTGWRR